jgi:MFS family permease
VLAPAVWVYGLGLALPAVTQGPLLLGALPVVAFAAALVMTLPFSLLLEIVPDRHHGAAAGLFGVSRGVGLLAGPVLAGLAIVALEPVFSATKGYAAVFVVAAAAVLASGRFVRRLPRG